MKLTYNDKLKIFNLRQKGYSVPQLSREFNIHKSVIQYFIKLTNKYGIEIINVKVKKSNNDYSKALKQTMIEAVLIHGHSRTEVVVEYGLPSKSILNQWITQYKKNGYNILENHSGK